MNVIGFDLNKAKNDVYKNGVDPTKEAGVQYWRLQQTRKEGFYMKILHINCNYMGTALHQTMVEHLDRLGVENTVFTPVHSLENAVITPRENVIACECFHKWDRIWFYRKQRKIQRALESRIAVGEFDLLHAYTLFTDGNCAYELSKKYNIPYVVAIRDTDVNAFFKWRPHLRSRGVEILANAKAVFFLSPAYKEQVLGKYIPRALREHIADKSYIVPNGIDEFWFDNCYATRDYDKTQKLLEQKCVRIIFVGRVSNRKNPLTTLRAIDLLEKRGYKIKFTVVGGFENAHIKKMLLSDKRVYYAGKLAKNDLIEQYRKNDIFVMPSRTETFGLVYAEAMSQGLPVIYTKGQGFDEQFPDGEVGYAIDPNSSADIASKIIAVMQNYELLSVNCREKYTKFNWNNIVKEYATIYSKIG